MSKEKTPSRQQKSNPPYTDNNTRNHCNGHNLSKIYNCPFPPVNWTILLNYKKPHKTISQVTIPPRMLKVVPATFNSIPKPDCFYNFIEMSVLHKSQQNLFDVPVLKIFCTKLPVHLFCTIISASSDDVILVKPPKAQTLWC